MRFDFNIQFTPDEFEDLGCDIVEIRENIILERFKKNKDLGIDGRNISNSKTTIVQCKKIQNVKDLINNLKNEELQKVKKLNPQRYILVLSSNPTVRQKDQIYTLFTDYIQSHADIITAEDIQSYLRKPQYENITKYYRELILSKNIDFTNLIENITSSNINNKSLLLKNDIAEIKKYFIETKPYKLSYTTLLKNHVIFLSGDAGSGKTTNAEMLLNQLMEEKYVDNIYKIDSCEELTTLVLSTNKIGILYDDFWGSTFSDLKLSLNSERQLQNLLQKIETKENIYFILTTREYVLKQGLAFYKDFHNQNLNRRIIHRNCNYTKQEKIKILFAHAKYSNLDFGYLYQIKAHANEIIMSKNYSPRSINFFITKHQDTNLDAYEFIATFLKYLNNPNDFFEAVFYKLSEGSQILAFVLSISNPKILISDLKKSFQSISKHINGIKPSLFEDYLHELLDFFLIADTNPYTIEFTNYSIFDFVNNEFSKKIIDYEDAFYEGVIYFNQIYTLFFKYKASIENENKLIDYLINNFDKLIITHDEEILLFIEEHKEPIEYLSHKIWKTLNIFQKTNNEKLKHFLYERINKMIHSFDNGYHNFDNQNFINIPEIIKFAEKIGIRFSKEDVIDSYLNNFKYLYELYYIKFFPKKYNNLLSLKLEELGKKLNPILEQRLLLELDILSYDGITIEYDNTIEELPNILNLLKIPQRKSIIEILEKNKTIFPKNNYLLEPEKQKLPKKTLTDIEIKKFEKELFLTKKLSIAKWRNMIKNSSLNEKNRKLLSNITNEKNKLWKDLSESTISFATLILNFYQNEQKHKQRIICDRKIYPLLLEYMNDLELTHFLEKYAFNTIKNSFESMSINHICSTYNISYSLVEKAIELGVLHRNNNLIDFNNNIFEIFLATQYMKENFDSQKEYFEFYLRDGILRTDEMSIMEEFNAYHFNKIILLPTLKKILNSGIGNFKKDILKITIENDYQSLSYSDELSLIDNFIGSLFGIEISTMILTHFDTKYKSKDSLLDYYNKKEDSLFNERIDELCDTYFSLLQELYDFLKDLKENENFYISYDNDGNIDFKCC